MKKNYIMLSVLSVSLLISGKSKAQGDPQKGEFSYSVSAGTTLSNLLLGFQKNVLAPLPDFKTEFGFGFYAGGLVNYALDDKGLSLEGGLDYTQINSKASTTGFNVDIRASVINLPISVRKSFSLGSVKLYGKLGGYIGYIFGKQTYYDESGEKALYSDFTDSKTINYGLIGQIGGYVYKGLSVNAGYNFGLQDLYNGVKSSGQSVTSEDKYLRYITAGLTYDIKF